VQPVAEASEITFGSTTIPFSILRSKRRKKTVEITLDPGAGVVVSAPMRTSLGDITRKRHLGIGRTMDGA
jgi:hypothetical protein